MSLTWTQACAHWQVYERDGTTLPAAGFDWPAPDAAIPANMNRALVAKILCAGSRAPSHTLLWLARHGDDLLPLPLKICLTLNWQEVPVPLVGTGDHAEVRYILLAAYGQSETVIWAENWGHLADQSVRAAAALALKAAGRKTGYGYVLWPRDTKTITGASLGLPLHLAALYLGRENLPKEHPLCQMHCWPPVLATGELAADSTIKQVNGIRAKSALRKKSRLGLQMMIYPNSPETLENPDCAFPVNSVDDACLALALHHLAPEAWKTMLRFEVDPMSFWRGLGSFSEEHVETVTAYAQRVGCFELPPDLKVEAARLTLQFLDAKEKSRPRNEITIKLCYERLLPPFTFDFVQKNLEAEAAFSLSQHWIKYLSHKGSQDAALWGKLVYNIKSEICKTPQGYEKFAEFLIRDLGLDHNRYVFTKKPDELLDNMEMLEENLQRYRNRHSTMKNPVLGKLYGKLIEHYSFMGLHAQAQRFLSKYMADYPDESSHIRALFNQAYLFWDIGEAEKADHCAEQRLSAGFDDADAYAQALIARRAYEKGRISIKVESLARQQLVKLAEKHPDPVHPWQLWAYNLGCVLKDSDFLMLAYELCKQESALLPMGLMPLAEMYTQRLADYGWLRLATLELKARLMLLCQDGILSKEHFSSLLLCDEWQQILTLVQNRRQSFFPFTYR